MKLFLMVTCLLLANNLLALDQSLVVQIKYAPWGLIDADEDEFEDGFDDEDFEKYDMHFDRSLGGRIIVEPFYIASLENVTDIDDPVPDARVRTYSLGLAGIESYPLESNSNVYLLGAIGLGVGHFKFKDPQKDADEALVEGNAEIGLIFHDHLMIGLGIDWQHFGEPAESKANFWNLYLGTGIRF